MALLSIEAVAQSRFLADWYPANTPDENLSGFRSMAYGDGRYVLVGTNGLMLVSENGHDWRKHQVGINNFEAVTYGNGRFVAVADREIIVSQNGVDWDGVQTHLSFLGVIHYSLGRFVGLTPSNIVASTDGLNWEVKASHKAATNALSISDDGDRTHFNALYEGWFSDFQLSRVQRSFWSGRTTVFGVGKSVSQTDRAVVLNIGTNWFNRITNGSPGFLSSLAYGAYHFVAVGQSGAAMVSTDGIIWRTNLVAPGADWKGVKFLQQRFFCFTDDGRIAYSNELLPPSPNTPPQVEGLPNLEATEGEFVQFKVTAFDIENGFALTYRVAEALPTGARFDENAGLFTWKTTESDGPSTTSLTISVLDSGDPRGVTRRQCSIVVRELNSVPADADMAVDRVVFGQPIAWDGMANDADLPTQSLTWTVAEGPPEAMFIEPGKFRWTPQAHDWNKVHRFVFHVTDSADPPGSIVRSNTVIVFPLGANPGFIPAESPNPLLAAPARGIEWKDGSCLVSTDQRLVISTNSFRTWSGVRNFSGFLTLAGNKFFGLFSTSTGDRLHISTNGWDWVPVEAGGSTANRTWVDIAFGNGSYMAIARDHTWPVTNRVLVSEDGESWTQAFTTKSNLTSCAAGNGRFLLGADRGYYLGAKGSSWLWIPFSGKIVDVAFGNGVFVAVGDRGRILTSRDGESWRERVWSRDFELGWVKQTPHGFFILGGRTNSLDRVLLHSVNAEQWTLLWNRRSSTYTIPVTTTPDSVIVAFGYRVQRMPLWVLHPIKFTPEANDGRFRLKVLSVSEGMLEVSSDLQDWKAWTNIIPGELEFEFSELDEAPNRFFRARFRSGILK